MTGAQAEERKRIETVLKRFAREDIGGPDSFHEEPARKLSEGELEKMRLKAERLKRQLEKIEGVRGNRVGSERKHC